MEEPRVTANSLDRMFERLWNAYSQLNPRVIEIHNLLKERSPNLQNDHIALRTLKHKLFGKEKLIAEFADIGYEICGHYHFSAKHLDAVHLENPLFENAPKVFISELLLDQCSAALQARIEDALIDKTDLDALNACEKGTGLSASGVHWGTPRYEDYQRLADESEYAAWFYVFGFVPNHFTVKINSLDQFDQIEALNAFLEDQGYLLNKVGGVVRGAPDVYLEQSSTMADKRPVQFEHDVVEIPSVFYEFAKRYPLPNGQEFSAFIEGNADKIFESTNVKS